MPPRNSPDEVGVRQLSFLGDEGDFAISEGESDGPPVTPFSLLSTARIWFRQWLVDQDRPQNTVESYVYDLVVLEQRITDKPIHRINETDIALYLADASSKVTRKRRLTSVKTFFRYLTKVLHVLKADPAENFSPHPLEHNAPDVLTENEQEQILAAASEDEPWSATAIWLMMRLGLGRTEVLHLKRDHIDRTPIAGPEILVAYDSPGKWAKQRRLQADAAFDLVYASFLERKQPKDVLFPYGPQAVNGMVERVAKQAGIGRRVTPQLLRQTAAVAKASEGLSINELLAFLGMANDARNRETVRILMDIADHRPRSDEEEET